jgi:hypothetical protein
MGYRITGMMLVATAAVLLSCAQQKPRMTAQNSLSQHTGAVGSTVPKAHPPYYPNTAGNIIAPPGNPAGNSPGSPPLVGGNENQGPTWP